MRKIPLTRGKFVYVDDRDFDFLNQWKWAYMPSGKSEYAFRSVVNKETKEHKTILMHRVINEPPKGLVTDHIDGNGLNNQRTNLRFATRCQNGANRKTHIKTKTNIKGVTVSKKADGTIRYRATLCLDYQIRYFGTYDTPEEAKLAWINAARIYQKEFMRE